MRVYKFYSGDYIYYTSDKILADAMNRGLSWFQRLCLFFNI